MLANAVGYSLWTDATALEDQIGLQTEEQAAQYTDPTRIAVECETAIVAASGEEQCIDSENEAANEAERSVYDLEAQQLMANWTRVMGKAAIIGMAVGILGLFLIFVTFWETRKAANLSRDTFNAYMDIERAIVEVSAGNALYLENGCDGRISFFISGRNVGRSGARILEFGLVFEPDGGLAKDIPTASVEIEIHPTQQKTLWQGESPKPLIETPFAKGVVIYKSGFRREHKSYFCFRIECKEPQSDFVNKSLPRHEARTSAWPKDT